MHQAGIYIHVPFCESKCPYCDFYSVTADFTLMNNYTDVICKLLHTYGRKLNLQVDTLYFGGGTPSILSVRNLSKIINSVKNNFNFLAEEVTLEINPMTLSVLDFRDLKAIGINRLSIGVQSAIDGELKLLGRKHTIKDVKYTIEAAQNSGFDNISLDLMIATPGQTIDTLKKSVDFCLSQNIQHISAYLLKIEKGTPFFEKKEHLHLHDEDEQANMYLFLVSELDKNGFYQYEISNFSKKTYQSKHNLKYWNGDEYLGLGPSAHSFLNGRRFFYPRSLNYFLKSPVNDIKFIEDGIGGTPEEYVMLRLRLKQGLNNKLFKEKFGYDIPKEYFEKAKAFEKYNLTQVKDDTITFTPKGFLLSNELIARIVL